MPRGLEVIGVKLDIGADLVMRVNEFGTKLALVVPPNCKTVKEFKAYLVSEIFEEKQKIKLFVGDTLYEFPDFTSVSVFLTHNDSAIRVAPEPEPVGFRRIPKSSIVTAMGRKHAVRFGQDIGSQYCPPTNLSPLNGDISINDNASSIGPKDSASVLPDDGEYETENSDGEDNSENKPQTRSAKRRARVRRGVATKAKAKALVTTEAALTSSDEKENKKKKSKSKKKPKSEKTKAMEKLEVPIIVVTGPTEVAQPSAQERPRLTEVDSQYPTFPSLQGSEYNDQIDPVSRKRHFASDTDSSNASEEECARTPHRGSPKLPKFSTNPEGLKRFMELQSQLSSGTKFDSPQLNRYMEPFGIASQVVFTTIAAAQEDVKKRLDELDFGPERDMAHENIYPIQNNNLKDVPAAELPTDRDI